MPVFDLSWREGSSDQPSDSDRPADLEKFGPLILVEVGLPTDLERALVGRGLPVPLPQVGYAMFDTGSSASAVDDRIFVELGVKPIDRIDASSSQGNREAFVYPAKVSFPTWEVNDLPMERLVGCSLKRKMSDGSEEPWTARDGKPIIMLIGRDMLGAMLFIYNGKTGITTIGF